LPFREFDLLEETVDPRPHSNGVESFNRSNAVDIDRHVLSDRWSRDDRDRAVEAVSAAAPAPTTSASASASAPTSTTLGARYIRIVVSTRSPGLVIRVPDGRGGHYHKNAPGTDRVQHRITDLLSMICLSETIGKNVAPWVSPARKRFLGGG